MLALERCQTGGGKLARAELPGRRWDASGAPGTVVDLADGATLGGPLGLGDLRHRADGAHRQPSLTDLGLELFDGAKRQHPIADLGMQLGPVLAPEIRRDEPDVEQQVVAAHHGAIALEHERGDGAGRDGDELAVGELEHRRFRSAEGQRFAFDVDVRQLVAHAVVDSEHRVHHGHVDVLPFAGAVAVRQRGQRGDHALEAGVDVGVVVRVVLDRGQRVAIVARDDLCEPRLGLHRRGERRPAAPRTGLAVSADRHHDQRRVDGEKILVSEAKAVERAGPEVLHHDVGLGHQVAHDVLGFDEVEVEADGALAAVLLGEVERHRSDVRLATSARVRCGGLDLDYRCAQVAQLLGAMGAGEHPGEVDDLDAVQRSGHRPWKIAVPGPVSA